MIENIEIPIDIADINIEWLQAVIDTSFADFKVYSYKLDKNINAGHGVISNTTGVEVRSSSKTKNLVIKLASCNEILKKLSAIYHYDYREVNVYAVFLKHLSEYSKSKKVSRHRFSAPECYFSKADLSTGKSVLVLENLFHKGYRMADYEAGLDFDHLSVATKVLANYHAAVISMKMERKIKNYKDVYPFILGTEPLSEPNQYITSGFQFTLQMLKEAEVSPKIINKLNIGEDAERIIMELLKPTEAMACVNHADCTGRNFMFYYDDCGKPVDAKLLDYQACLYASRSTNDLYLLLLCSGKPNVLQGKSLQSLEELYRNTLTAGIHEHGFTDWEYTDTCYQQDRRMGRLTSTLHCIAGSPVWFGKSEDGRERLINAIIEADDLGLFEILKKYSN